MSDTEQPLDDDDFLSDLGFGTPRALNNTTPEEDFYSELTGNNGEKYAKLDTMRYGLNHEMSQLQHLRDRGVNLSILADVTEAKPIPGAVAKPVVSPKKALRPLTNLEYLKLKIEYYLLMQYHPRFQVIEGQPQRRVCSLSKMVDMIAEYETIKQLINKRY